MSLLLRHRQKLILGAGAILVLLSICPIRDILVTLRILSNLGAAAREELPTEKIIRLDLRAEHPSGQRRAILYRFQDRAPRVGILFVPGLTPLGPEHPRFTVLARTLAKLGYAVLSLDIKSFRQFKLEVDALEHIRFWYHYLKDDPSVCTEAVGIVGISVAGTLGLMTAAQDDIREEIAFVVSIGGYQDLARCNRYWFSSEVSEQRHGDYSVRCYGKWVSMLAALDTLQHRSDRRAMEEVLRSLLATGKQPAQMPRLTKEGLHWYHLAAVEDRATNVELVGRIEDSLSGYFDSLSPNRSLSRVGCPVFLVHGIKDELIPSGETVQLQKRLTATQPHVLLTPLISHTHPRHSQLSLLEKWSGYVETARFLHAFLRCQPVSKEQTFWEKVCRINDRV